MNNRFWTLTYSREALADDAELNLEDLQKWIRYMRRRVGKFRYFAVGEYGEKNGRGHWHVLTFGRYFPFHRYLGEGFDKPRDGPLWPYRYDVASVTTKSIAYVAAYCTKNLRDPRRAITAMSLRPGIGLDAISRMAKQAAKDGIPEWPTSYRVGDGRYPLITGGLEKFKSVYLEAGGVPPASLTPYERDIRSRVLLSDRGTQLQMERLSRLEKIQSGEDSYALSQQKSQIKKLP